MEVENSFAGNICRCTGYRPIADAFKSFATDAEQSLLDKVCDLEDLGLFKPCGLECSKKCQHRKCKLNEKTILGKFYTDYQNGKDVTENEENWCVLGKMETKMIVVDAGTHKWYKAFSLDDVYKAMGDANDYKLIAGNTGQGTIPYYTNDLTFDQYKINRRSNSTAQRAT